MAFRCESWFWCFLSSELSIFIDSKGASWSWSYGSWIYSLYGFHSIRMHFFLFYVFKVYVLFIGISHYSLKYILVTFKHLYAIFQWNRCFLSSELSIFIDSKGVSWSWSYGSWIYSYRYNQYISPLTLWGGIPPRRGVLDAILCDQVCQFMYHARKMNGHVYVCKVSCIYVLRVVYMCVKGHVYVC
jgi:hypothetical protein